MLRLLIHDYVFPFAPYKYLIRKDNGSKISNFLNETYKNFRL